MCNDHYQLHAQGLHNAPNLLVHPLADFPDSLGPCWGSQGWSQHWVERSIAGDTGKVCAYYNFK